MRSRRVFTVLGASAVAVAAAMTAVAPAHAQAGGVIGYYQIRNDNSNKCLEVYNWSKQPGATVDQWTCGTPRQSNQTWELVGVGSNVELINENSKLCLTSYNVPGNGVTQTSCTGNAFQLWSMSTVAGAGFLLQNQASGAYFLEVYGASKNNGAIVDTWYYNDGGNQIWNFSAA